MHPITLNILATLLILAILLLTTAGLFYFLDLHSLLRNRKGKDRIVQLQKSGWITTLSEMDRRRRRRRRVEEFGGKQERTKCNSLCCDPRQQARQRGKEKYEYIIEEERDVAKKRGSFYGNVGKASL